MNLADPIRDRRRHGVTFCNHGSGHVETRVCKHGQRPRRRGAAHRHAHAVGAGRDACTTAAGGAEEHDTREARGRCATQIPVHGVQSLLRLQACSDHRVRAGEAPQHRATRIEDVEGDGRRAIRIGGQTIEDRSARQRVATSVLRRHGWSAGEICRTR